MIYVLSTSLNLYHPQFGNVTLNMCHHDAQRFTDALPPNHLLTRLRDGEATASEYLAQLDWMATQAQPGEVCYLYFSGHGTFFDLPKGRKTGRVLYDRVVWDHEVTARLRKFEKGVTVISISDCCHAESNSRFTASAYNVRVKSIPPSGPVRPYLTSTRGIRCAFFALSACTVMQTAKEIRNPVLDMPAGGIFTSALLREMRNNIPIRGIVRSVQQHIAPHWEQTVRLEYVNGRALLSYPFVAHG